MSVTTRELNKLANLLDEERAALRGGDMDRIDQLGARKLALIERLEEKAFDLPQSATSLGERIAQSARRNQQLIASALQGVRDAQELLARARLPRSHETYARDGMRQKIDSAPGRLEKRA
mgnify:CR=1 FL=1